MNNILRLKLKSRLINTAFVVAATSLISNPEIRGESLPGSDVSSLNSFQASSLSAGLIDLIKAPPTILIQPRSQIVQAGTSVTLSVSAIGTPRVSYQWSLNGEYIPDATGPSLKLANLQPADAGVFSVTVYNEVGAIESAKAEIKVIMPALPFHDNYNSRGLIAGMSGSGQGSNISASREEGEPRHAGGDGGKSVWVRWIAPSSGVATFSTAGSTFDTTLAVYKSSLLGRFNLVAGDDDSGGYYTSVLEFNAVLGQTYDIAVDSAGKSAGNIVLNWHLTPSLTLLPTVTRSLVDKTAKAGDALNLGFDFVTDTPVTIQWFKNGVEIPGMNERSLSLNNLQPADVGQYSVRLSADGKVLHQSAPVEVQINTEGLTDVQAKNKLSDAARSGLIGKPGPSADDSSRNLRLSAFGLRSTASTANGKAAEEVRRNAGGSYQLRDSSMGSGYVGAQYFGNSPGHDPDEPNHCGVVGGASYWFAYTPAESGTFRLTTDGSSIDTVLAIYRDTDTGYGYDSLESIACDNNSGLDGLDSALTCNIVGGNIYYIVVDGVNGAVGSIALNYNLNAAPTISSISNRTISEDTSTGAISFTIGDRETSASSLNLSATSSNPTLVPNSNITLGGSGTSRTVSVLPATNKFGTSTITVSVNDGTNTCSTSFQLTVNSVNDAPVATPDIRYRPRNGTLHQIPISYILGNDTDVDGDTVTLTGITSTSAAGMPITISGSNINYYIPNGLNFNDYFLYYISDGKGGTATGVVLIYVD